MRTFVLLLVGVQVGASATAAVLWDQSAYDLMMVPIVDQEFTDYPYSHYSVYQVNDVQTHPGGWQISSVTLYFTCGYGNWAGVTQARLNIFPKTGSLPENIYHPENGPVVTVSKSNLGTEVWEVTASGLDIALPGDTPYWIGLTPIAPFGQFGQEYHLAVATMIGDQAAIRNPGGGTGYTGWAAISFFGFGAFDTAFKIEGTIIPEPAGLVVAGMAVLLRRR